MISRISTFGKIISIHAPPRGATVIKVQIANRLLISIHAPPRGATHCGKRVSAIMLFQFTPLREGRRLLGFHAEEGGNISIHAPPRGATLTQQKKSKVERISIHAPPRGATGKTLRIGARTVRFQFTPLREGRHRRHASRQPRDVISIHAPPRGATCVSAALCAALSLFQFTPLREGRLCRWKCCSRGRHFNSRPSARGDHPLPITV
mgnify:FL=1